MRETSPYLSIAKANRLPGVIIGTETSGSNYDSLEDRGYKSTKISNYPGGILFSIKCQNL
jgi:hypothetical protein